MSKIYKLNKYRLKINQLGGIFELINDHPYIKNTKNIICNTDKIIGNGSYGKVVMCDYEDKKNVFVEKIFSMGMSSNYNKELNIGIYNENILRKCKILYPIATDVEKKSILYDYKGISLDKFIEHQKLTEYKIYFNYINIIKQVLLDLICIYNTGFINTDVKINNIVINTIDFFITEDFISNNNIFVYEDNITHEIKLATLTIIDIDSIVKIDKTENKLINLKNTSYTVGTNLAYWTATKQIINDIPPLYGIASLISYCMLNETSNIVRTFDIFENILQKCKSYNDDFSIILEKCIYHTIPSGQRSLDYILHMLSHFIPENLKSIDTYIKTNNIKYQTAI